METRTPNPQNANLVLYQLSYNPVLKGMGLNGLEPLTPALSERCSNQTELLSHNAIWHKGERKKRLNKIWNKN